MGLDPTTAVRWGTVEEVMERLATRNKKLRIIHDSLYVRVRGNDPIYAWDTEAGEHVYVRKQDWLRASPAIRTTEACIILRITPAWFKHRRDELGIKAKITNPRKLPDVPKQGPMYYYTVNDIIEISRELPRRGTKVSDAADEYEIRNLFSQGYVPYKKTKNGDFIPVWSETIY